MTGDIWVPVARGQIKREEVRWGSYHWLDGQTVQRLRSQALRATLDDVGQQ